MVRLVCHRFIFLTKQLFGLASPLEKLIGFPIFKHHLFLEAVTHSSKKTKNNYDRLEFLGDAVLDSVMSDWLFNKYPNHDEGKLTVLRARYVSRISLSKFAMSIGLQKFIKSNKVSFDQINDTNIRILGDVLESLIGAIYLAYGYRGAALFVKKRLLHNLDLLAEIDEQLKNYKGILLEKSQSHKFNVEFEFEPYNGEYYLVTLLINKKRLAYGRGATKKKAEQSASKYVIEHPALLQEFTKEIA